jgi:hypothetical protein
VHILASLSVVEEFIKQSDTFLQNLAQEKNLRTYFVNANLAILVLSAAYGATMGIYSGGLQVLYSAIKVPMLLLMALYLTAPSYHVLYSLLGGKQTISQTVVLLLFGFTITSTVLIALLPVNLFFMITTTQSSETHAFIALLNIAIFALGGFFALTYFIKGAENLFQKPLENWKPAFLLGSIILMFVGTQLAWVLRPFFNYYEGFIRPLEGNFYTAVLGLLARSLGIFGPILIAFGLIFVVWLFYSELISPK